MGKKDLEEVVIYNNLIFIVSINRLGQHWSRLLLAQHLYAKVRLTVKQQLRTNAEQQCH